MGGQEAPDWGTQRVVEALEAFPVYCMSHRRLVKASVP